MAESYLVTQTKTMLVETSSAAEARKTAELIFALAPGNKSVTNTVKVEKVK